MRLRLAPTYDTAASLASLQCRLEEASLRWYVCNSHTYMAKAIKIDKEFLVTDESVNVYGFRLLTSGYQLERFRANPIGYRQHKRDDGVVVKWEDFRLDGDKLYAKPSVNLSNPKGQQTLDEINNGFLNAASMGGIVVLEVSEAPEMILPGQTGPTITKWYNKEISLVDVPGNPNATAVQLYDANDNEINLTDFIHNTLKKLPEVDSKPKTKTSNMSFKLAILAALAVNGISLADDTADADLAAQIRKLAADANKLPEVEQNLADKTAEAAKAVQDLADLKAKVNETRIKEITDAGVKSGKLSVIAVKDLSAKYADDPEGLQALIDALPAYQTVTGEIADGAANDLSDKSWSELDRAGKLPELKEKHPDLYVQKFKEKFGKEPA